MFNVLTISVDDRHCACICC